MIRTRRLTLRPFRRDDIADVLICNRDPEMQAFAPDPRPWTREDAARFVAQRVAQPSDDHPIWAVEHEGVVVGEVDLDSNARHRRAELGYAIGHPYWENGFAAEAARAVIDAAFTAIPDLDRIFARVAGPNVRSWRAFVAHYASACSYTRWGGGAPKRRPTTSTSWREDRRICPAPSRALGRPTPANDRACLAGGAAIDRALSVGGPRPPGGRPRDGSGPRQRDSEQGSGALLAPIAVGRVARRDRQHELSTEPGRNKGVTPLISQRR